MVAVAPAREFLRAALVVLPAPMQAGPGRTSAAQGAPWPSGAEQVLLHLLRAGESRVGARAKTLLLEDGELGSESGRGSWNFSQTVHSGGIPPSPASCPAPLPT